MRNILIFRHESRIQCGRFAEVLRRFRVPFRVVKIDEGDSVPDDIPSDAAGLAFWGGTMSANDSFSWIQKEDAGNASSVRFALSQMAGAGLSLR